MITPLSEAVALIHMYNTRDVRGCCNNQEIREFLGVGQEIGLEELAQMLRDFIEGETLQQNSPYQKLTNVLNNTNYGYFQSVRGYFSDMTPYQQAECLEWLELNADNEDTHARELLGILMGGSIKESNLVESSMTTIAEINEKAI